MLGGRQAVEEIAGSEEDRWARAVRKGEGDLRFQSWRFCSAIGVCSGWRVLDTRKRACGGHIKVRKNAKTICRKASLLMREPH